MRCKSCGQDCQPEQFYASNQTKCKECVKKAAKQNRMARIDYYRSYDRMRAAQPHRKANAKRVIEQWKVEHPKRRAAQVAVGNAVRDGRLIKLPCLVCGNKAEAHHPDYDRPLDVMWLCPAHHKQTHALVANDERKEAA